MGFDWDSCDLALGLSGLGWMFSADLLESSPQGTPISLPHVTGDACPLLSPYCSPLTCWASCSPPHLFWAMWPLETVLLGRILKGCKLDLS